MPRASATMPSADTIARPSMRSGRAMFAAELIRVPANAKGGRAAAPSNRIRQSLLDVPHHAGDRPCADGRQLGLLDEFLIVLRQRRHGAASLHVHDFVA